MDFSLILIDFDWCSMNCWILFSTTSSRIFNVFLHCFYGFHWFRFNFVRIFPSFLLIFDDEFKFVSSLWGLFWGALLEALLKVLLKALFKRAPLTAHTRVGMHAHTYAHAHAHTCAHAHARMSQVVCRNEDPFHNDYHSRDIHGPDQLIPCPTFAFFCIAISHSPWPHLLFPMSFFF